MARESEIPDAFRAARTNGRGPSSPRGAATARPTATLRGLLITGEARLAGAFKRELQGCATCSLELETYVTQAEAARASSGLYDWVAVDLDGALAPSEAVRLAREAWGSARVAVLSCWWSERDTVARDLADVVIHKPVRSPELLAFLQAVASGSGPLRARERDETLSASTG